MHAVEALEPRIVFAVNVGAGAASATALSVLQVNEIVAGLEDLGSLGNALENEGVFATDLEGLGLSFGELFNFSSGTGKSGFLADAFKDQLADLMASTLPTGPTVAQINTWLGTSPLAGTTGEYGNVTWTLHQGGEYGGANPFEWDVTITGTRSSEQNLELGANAADAGISLATAPKVATDAGTSFRFSFGLDNANKFFATFGDSTFSVAGTAPLAGMTGEVEYDVDGDDFSYALATGSAVSLGVSFSGVTFNERAPANGTWSRTELTAAAGNLAPADFTVGSTTDSGLQATLRLATGGGTPVQMLLTDNAILDAAAPEVDHDVALIDYVAGGNLTGIFQRIQDGAALLDNNPLRSVNIPGIGTAFGAIEGLPAYAEILSLRDAANAYLTSAAAPTFKGLADHLSTQLSASLATSGVDLESFALTTQFDPSTSSILFSFAVDTGDLTKTFQFDRLGSAAAQAGLSFNRDQNLDIEATFRAQGDFGFGLDLAHANTSAASVFFTSGSLGASLSFDVTGIDLAATLGPVAAGIVDGEVHASANVMLDLVDATDDGRYTLAELNNGNEVRFDLSTGGNFSAELPLDIKIAGATFASPMLRLVSDDILEKLPTVDTTTPNFDKLFNMGKVGPEAILDLIIAVGDWASNFRNASIFDANIPFLDIDLGGAFDFGLLFTKNLRDKLQNDLVFVPLKGDFQSFTLAGDAPLIVGGGDVSERIVLPSGTYASRAAVITALNDALGDDSAFEAQEHGDNGLRIAAKDANAIGNFGVMGASHQLKTIGFLDSSAVVSSEVKLPLAAPANGKITADAKFQYSVDGSTPVTITLTKTATDNNATVADLAADLDAALSGTGIDAAADGGNIKLVRADGKSFMVVGVSGTTFQQIGLENISAAGLTDLGSSIVSGLRYTTLTDMVPFLLDELGLGDGDGDPTNDPIRAHYDLATETFYLHFEHAFNLPEVHAPIALNFELDGWASLRTVDANGNPTTATLSFVPNVSGSFDFGIKVGGDSSFQELTVKPGTGFAPNGYAERADGSPNPYDALPWDGKLKADASFRISLDNGVEHTLTILKSATDANTTAADALADVKAAIAANPALNGKIDARVLPRDGGTAERIEFYTLEQTGDFQLRNLRVRLASPGAVETMGFGPDQLEISEAPVLGVANEAQANLDFSPTGDVTFSVSLDGGAPVRINVPVANMATNANMADLLADINAAIATTSLAGELQAIRYGAGSQFQIVAAEGTRQMTFKTESSAAQTTLKFGSDQIVTRSRGGTFFVKDASLEASATLSLTDLNLAAQLGFIGLTTEGIEGGVTLSASLELEDGDGNTSFEVGELFSRLINGSIADIVQYDFAGTANASMSGLKVDAGLLALSANAGFSIASSDIFATGGPDFEVTFEGFDPTKLLNFSNLSWREIYEGIKTGVEFLSQTEQFGFLSSTKIPLVNISIGEAFNYTDQFLAKIDELTADPAAALAQVEARIEELLGIPAQNFALSLEEGSIVKIHLGISTSYTQTYGLDFNLAEIAKYTNADIPADLLTLGGFIDASAEGSLQFGAYAGVSLDLGLDFSGGATTPGLVLYSSSGVDVGVRLTGQNLNIRASFGPAGFEITDGSVVFDGDGLFDADEDGVQDNDFATIHFGPLENITDVAGTVAAIKGGASLTEYFGPTFTGVIKAVLPGAITSDIGSLDLPGPIGVDVPDVSKLFSSDATIRKGALTLTLPDMSGLLPEIPGLMQLLRDPAILLDGVDSGLSLIQKLLSGKAATNLPLIGNQLRSGAGFIEEFRSGFIADLTAKLRGAGDRLLDTMQQGMFDLFASEADGAVGLQLGILKDYNSDGAVTKDDVVLTFRKLDGSIWVEGVDDPRDQDAVQFNLHFGQGIELGTDLDIEWGLPGLELDINGSPTITAGWDLFFGFGVSVSDFFYLDAAPPEEFTGSGATLTAGNAVEHELRLGFDVVLTPDGASPFSATGRLFFLQLDAVDKQVNGEYSRVGGAFFVDLADPGTAGNQDGRVTIKELFSKGTVKPITAGLEAEAIVNLALTASVGGNTAIPRVLADFSLDWEFQLGQPVQTPSVGFANVRLDLGSFVTDFLKPIIDKVNDIIKPFDPVLDALQTRIPVLSDIMGRNYTVLDLAVQFGKVDRRFVDAVLQVRELVADIAALPAGVSVVIPIGEMLDLGAALSKPGGTKSVDTSSLGNQALDFGSNLTSQQQQYQNTFNKTKSVTGGGFAFPILKPANAFKLLLGQDATLVTYDIPRLEVGMSMSRTFPIWGPLVGKFNGSISAFADFAIGFDTKGFNTFRTSGDVVDILDGFFISDRANPDGTGADVPEAGFKGRIGIGGAINAAIIEAGIEGFFELTANLDLKDPNDDGKIRGSELIALITHPNGYGPLNLGSIHLKGEVGARAYVDFWAPFSWYNAWEWEFARITLFDKVFTAPDVTPQLSNTQMIGAENTLVLNAGPTANKREFISTSDVGEEFIVSGSGKNITVTFTNTGHTQSFTGVDRLVMNGGKGNDRLIIGAGITTAITFDGGEGDDYFEGGDGDDIVIGGIGNDTIIGGGGNNFLDGGDGADIITGGSGNDIIIGGIGDDVINGGGGNDTYRFGDNWGRDVFEGEQTGTGAFDFTASTKDLTLNITAGGVQGTSGSNLISYQGTVPYITSVKGGSGNDITTIAATGTATVTVDGGAGSDQYLVSFGRLNTAIQIQDTGSGILDSDTVAIQPLTRDYTISVGDQYVSGVKAGVSEQRANFTNGVENLTVDAKSNGGSVVQIAEAISYAGDVRILARQSLIENTIDSGNLRIESTMGVNIAANVNAHANGNVTVLVNGGNITVTEDVMSSAGAGFTGDGAGLIHLFTSGGSIQTGAGNGGPGRVLAGEGALLLRGTNGSIGSLDTPIYSTIAILAAYTTGGGIINLHESDGMVVSTIASIEGIETKGGLLNLFNDDRELRIESPIKLNGGHGTITTDEIQINADIVSLGGNLFLRPEGDLTVMSIGDGVSGEFAIDQSEINHLVNGFASLQVGLPLGRNLINLGTATFTDVTLLQNPVLGGHINQTGLVTVTDGATFTILGSGHTTELNNQVVASHIDIIDSAIVRQGETVTLTSLGGNININFDLDGTAGGLEETLILNAAGEVVIKGAIGSTAQLGTLQIIGATNIRFEGSVNVKHLILDDGTTVTIDGTVTAEDVALNGVGSATFRSGVVLSTGLTSSGSTLASAIFQGQVIAPTIALAAQALVDFYQLVDVTSTLSVNTTNATGDIIFRQQVNAHSGDITVESFDDITFVGSVSADDLQVVRADSLAFQANVNLLGSFVQNLGAGITSFAQFTASSANITSSELFLGGITTLTGASGFVANLGSGAFNAAAAVSVTNGPLNITARTISFQGTVAAASATLAANESISVANASSFSVTGGLNATTTNPAVGEIKFTGPVAVGTDASFSTPRALTFQNTLSANGGLTVGLASSTQYQGAVSVGGAFTQSASVTGASAFSTTLNAGSLNLQADSFSFSGDVTSGGAAAITAKTGGISAAANVAVAGALDASAATNIALLGNTAAHSVALSAAGTVTIGTGGITTAASPTLGGVTIITTGAVAGNSVTINGIIDAKGALEISAARGVLAANTVHASSINASGTALTFNSLVTAVGAATFNTTGALNLAAGLTAGGALTVSNAAAVTFGDTVAAGSASITAANTIAISIGGLSSTTGSISLTTTAAGAGNAITAMGPIDSAANLQITTPRGAALGLIEAANLTVDAFSINLPATVSTNGAITLTASAAGNITAGSTITAGGALTIPRAKTIAFSGLVSADSVAIGQGAGASAETVTIGVGGMEAAGDLRIRTTVAGAGNGVTALGALSAGDTATLALDSARGVDTTGSLSAGSLEVSGASITLRAGTNVMDDVTLGATGAINVQSDLIAGDDVTVTQAGALTFGGKLTAGDLAVTATTSANFNGRVTLSGSAVLALSGDLTTAAEFTVGNQLTVSSARDVSFGGLVTADAVSIGTSTARNITVTAAGVAAASSVTLRSTDSAGTILINGPIAVANGPATVSAAGSISSSAAISADTIAVTAPSMTLAGALNADAAGVAGTIALNSAAAGVGSIVVSGITSATGSLLVGNVQAPQTVALNGSIFAGQDITVAAAASISTGSTVTAARNIGFTAGNTISLAAGGLSTTTGSIALTTTNVGAGTGIASLGPIRAATLLAVNTPRGASLDELDAQSLVIDAQSINLPAEVAATQDISLTAASTGNITIGSTVTAGGAVTVHRAKGITFSGLVSSDSLAIAQAPGNSVESVAVGAGGISTTNDLRIRSTVAGSGNGITTLGALIAGNTATISLDSARGVDVTSTITGGDLAVVGTSITLRSGVTLADDITFSATGPINVNADITAGDDLSVTQAGALNFAAKLTANDLSVANTVSAAFNGKVELGGTASLTLTGDLVTAAEFSAATSLTVASVRDASFGALVTSGTVEVGTTNARTITVTAAGITTSGALTLRSTNAAGAVVTNGPLTATDGVVTLSAVGPVTSSATITADSIAVTSPAVNLGGALVADGTGATGHLTINSTAAGTGAIILGGLTSVTGSMNLGTTAAPQSIALNGSVTAGLDLQATATETISAGASITTGRDVTLTTTSVNAGEIRLTGNLAAGRDLSVAAARNATFLAPVSVGRHATLSSGAAMQFESSLSVVGSLSIPSAAQITVTGALSAAEANIAGGSFVAGTDFTITTGGALFTTTGDVAVAGKTTIAQALVIAGSDDVSLAGAVRASSVSVDATSFLAGSTFTTTVGDAEFTTDGNIRIVGLATVADDLTIDNALNVTFQSQLAVQGDFVQLNGGNATRFEGVATANSIYARTAQLVFAGSTLRALNGDLTIESDEIDFFGGTNSVQGSNGNLVLRPYLAGTSIDVGSPTPTGILDLSDVDLNALQKGFHTIVIGRAEDATGAMLIGSSTFRDDVVFHAGSITVESNVLVGQFLTSQETLRMTARTGSILFNDDVFATEATLQARDNITINNRVDVTDFVVVNAGSDGSGNINLHGAITTTAAAGYVNFTAGADSGSILITGTVATITSSLSAVNGAILQTAGNVKAADLTAVAESGITLLTTADHISARVTGTGDMHITDTNTSAAHFVDLGSKTDVNDGLFTADGDITVIANQNVNAFRVAANGSVTITADGEVYLDKVSGAPVSVTGTILIDEDRTTNGQEIRFDGNIRLLRDITLTSNGGDIIITGRINGTAGEHFGLTFNAGGGSVNIGGPIGNVTPLEFLQVNDVAKFTLNGGARIENDTEINADEIAIAAPKGSIVTTLGGELRLLPNNAAAAIDLGSPANGSALFSLSDAELAALGNGYSLIQIGLNGAQHDIRIESARFLDDLELNGNTVTLLTSSVAQAVNGLSVVNGQDDNDITINAETAFVQGKRAGLVAGRKGNISITADTIALDGKSRGLIRGYGELLLQPFTASQPIVLGGQGAGFELTNDEFGTLGDNFSRVIIGRADGSHEVSITKGLNLRDATLIRTPLGDGSVTIGTGSLPMTLQTLGRADNLRIEAAQSIIVDANVKTVGRASLELLADFDANGVGDLLIGQNLSKTNKSALIGSEFGAIRLQGENITLGIEIPALKTAGMVNVKSLGGNVDLRVNVDGDADGGFTFRHLKSTIATTGTVKVASTGNGGIADLGAGLISGTRGIELSGFADIVANGTKMKSSAKIMLDAINTTLKAKTALTSLAEIQVAGDPAIGVITLEAGSSIRAKNSVLLEASQIQRAATALVTAKSVTINDL